MIDASKGFMKDGPKNRLRSQDIHKIVDVFNKQIEIERYSRMVPLSEIADPKNDYNLNIPRYIDSSEPEDIQDLHAHLHGGIPDRDLDALGRLLGRLPEPARARCSSRTGPATATSRSTSADVQQTILDSAEFKKFAAEVDAARSPTGSPRTASAWRRSTPNTKPNDLIADARRRPAGPLQAGATARRVRRLRAAHDLLARRPCTTTSS